MTAKESGISDEIMMNKKYFIWCFIILCFTSCKHKNIDMLERFDVTFNIYAEKLNVDTYQLKSFGKMILVDGQECIIKENYIGESLLDKIYYKKDSVTTFAAKGNGPDEYIMPRLIQIIDKANIGIIDLSKRKIVTKSLSGEVLSIQNLHRPVISAIQIKKGYITSGVLDTTDSETKRYSLLNASGDFVKSFGDFPNDNKQASNKCKLLAYEGWMAYSSKYNRLASVSCSGSIFEIYQMDDTPVLVQHYYDKYPEYSDDSNENTNSIKHEKNNIIGFVDIYSTDKYIYTLYSGKPLETFSNEGMLNASSTNHILIFDWDGNCVCKLESDTKLFNFCVSSDNKTLIALGWENDYELYSFDLSNIQALKVKQTH